MKMTRQPRRRNTSTSVPCMHPGNKQIRMWQYRYGGGKLGGQGRTRAGQPHAERTVPRGVPYDMRRSLHKNEPHVG